MTVQNQKSTNQTRKSTEPVPTESLRRPTMTTPIIIEFETLNKKDQLQVLAEIGFTGNAALEFRALSLGQRQSDRVDLGQKQPKKRSKKS